MDRMCAFGKTGVPVRREYFGRLEEADSRPEQAPSLDIGLHTVTEKPIEKGPLVSTSLRRAGRKPPRRGVGLSLRPRACYLWWHKPPILP